LSFSHFHRNFVKGQKLEVNYELCELLRAEISELIVRRINNNILYYDTNIQLFYNTPRAFIVTCVTIISMV